MTSLGHNVMHDPRAHDLVFRFLLPEKLNGRDARKRLPGRRRTNGVEQTGRQLTINGFPQAGPKIGSRRHNNP